MSTKVQSTTNTTQQTTPQESEYERQTNPLRVEQFKQVVGPQTQVQLAGLNELQKLFSGQALSPFFTEASQGISPEAIGYQASNLARSNLAGFQQLGLTDSGVAFRETARDIANQLLFPSEQFNIGAKQNLLNLAFGGQAQVQQPIVAQTGALGAQLAGLRSVASTGSGSYTQRRNPFLENLYGSLGSSLGSGTFGNTGGWFGV